MNKKLLLKTLKAYLIYAVLILIISAPLFYFAIKRLYTNEADDTLLLHKKEFLKQIASLKYTDIPQWNKYNRNAKIDSNKKVYHDSLFFSAYYDTLDAEIEPYRELNYPIKIENKEYTFSEKINLIETEDLLKNIAILFFSIISILLIGLFFITKKLSLHLWKPFYKTLEQIESFEIDKTKHPNFLKTDIEEFNRLNTSIQKLIEKNTIIYNSQKEFIENAAHELQTPLAVFKAKVDTLMQRTDVTQEQSEILNTLNENITRITRLNKNLLLLSKIENDSYNDKQTIPISNYIEKNLAFFTEQASAKSLVIKVTMQYNFDIYSNPSLTEILISNLFLNAIKHNNIDGIILIEIQNNKLIFSNTGISNTLNKSKLFKRFSKVNPSENGTGLGLSIVKKITDSNGWSIEYHYNHPLHSFIINF
ncbi:sensor histidine kinase [Ferruginibacter yonginensis]|uniref:histidine kinase n=1 Tax=Ferruginibacter yonginensis TaxID=1310416 RepID=A0ABV8QUK8_9BACT